MNLLESVNFFVSSNETIKKDNDPYKSLSKAIYFFENISKKRASSLDVFKIYRTVNQSFATLQPSSAAAFRLEEFSERLKILCGKEENFLFIDVPLLNRVKKQFQKIFEKTLQAIEEQALFKAQNFLFWEIYQCIQNLKEGVHPSFFSLLHSLPAEDSNIFFKKWVEPSFSNQKVIENNDVDILDSLFETMLLEKVKKISDPKAQIYDHLRMIALEEGVKIESWDREWGFHHLKNNCGGSSPWLSRLAKGFSRLDLVLRQHELDRLKQECTKLYSEEITKRLFKHCPFIAQLRTHALQAEWKNVRDYILIKAQQLSTLQELKKTLFYKHPKLILFFNDPSHSLNRLWHAKELGILTFPTIANGMQEMIREAKRLVHCLEIFLKEDFDIRSAEIHLQMILKKCLFSSRPTEDQVKGEFDLRRIRKSGLQLARKKNLDEMAEKTWNSLYRIPVGKKECFGKYKPLNSNSLLREVKGYAYDVILGIGMTPPTSSASLSMESSLIALKKSFQLCGDKFDRVKNLRKLGEKELAHVYHNEVLQLHDLSMQEFEGCDDFIKQEIYLCLANFFDSNEIEMGKNLFWSNDLEKVTDQNRIRAIDDFLRSESFNNFKIHHSFENKQKQGSIQRWISGDVKRIHELIAEDPLGGMKLKAIPKPLVHYYCILGLIKGSRDGHSKNALAVFNQCENVQIYECDDEYLMPAKNHYSEFRLWQFGLPQADLPFDRTALELFSQSELLGEIRNYNHLDKKQGIRSECYLALEERVEKMLLLFQRELEKVALTLTPRQLFFQICGGEESFNYFLKEEKMNPSQIFEFCTSVHFGKGLSFPGDQEKIAQNFFSLHGMEYRNKLSFNGLKKLYPKAALFVHYDAGYGNNLFIKASFLKDSNQCVPLKNVTQETWILETEDEIQEGEYTLYLNEQVQEIDHSRRKIDSDDKSRIVIPSFRN